MRQDSENKDMPRPDPGADDVRNYGGKGSRRVQGRGPKSPHYDPSGRWAEKPGADPYPHEEQGQSAARQRFARSAEWDFRPDSEPAPKKQH